MKVKVNHPCKGLEIIAQVYFYHILARLDTLSYVETGKLKKKKIYSIFVYSTEIQKIYITKKPEKKGILCMKMLGLHYKLENFSKHVRSVLWGSILS